MKKQFTFLVMLLLGVAVFAQEVIVEWNFPEEGTDSIADGGIAQNLNQPIYTMGGTSNLNYKNGSTTKAAQATHWDEGTETKCWVVELNTENYGSLLLNSKLSSGGNDPGPRDFRVDFKIGEDGTWGVVPNSEIITANDWDTGVLEELLLPEDCSNQPLLYLRWIMTSDTSSTGEIVASGGKLKIDDIIIKGTNISGVEYTPKSSVLIYPNPFTSSIHINNSGQSVVIEIYDNTGRLVHQNTFMENNAIHLNHLNSGIYLVRMFDIQGNELSSKKLLKK